MNDLDMRRYTTVKALASSMEDLLRACRSTYGFKYDEDEDNFRREAMKGLQDGDPKFIKALVMSREKLKPLCSWMQRQVISDKGMDWPP